LPLSSKDHRISAHTPHSDLLTENEGQASKKV
jgi:hypothetical protein